MFEFLTNFNFSIYGVYLKYLPWLILAIVFTFFGKHVKFFFSIMLMKKRKQNPVIIHMRFLDGTGDIFLFDRKGESKFQVREKAYHYADESGYYAHNKFFGCPEEWHVEEWVEPINPYLYKMVYATENVPVEYRYKDEQGNEQLISNARLIPILPNRIDPRKYDTMLTQAFKLGLTKGKTDASIIIVLCLAAAAAAAAAAYFGYQNQDLIQGLSGQVSSLRAIVGGA